MSDPFRPHPHRMTLTASTARRFFAIGTMAILGGMLLYVVMAQPPATVGATIFLLVLGLVALFGADALRRATAVGLIYEDGVLQDSAGTVLARIEDIRAVERGAFAFKPSNGFLLRLKSSQSRHWSPGLWWRMGRRVGVGGVTGAGEAKAMAEAIAFDVAYRDQVNAQ